MGRGCEFSTTTLLSSAPQAFTHTCKILNFKKTMKKDNQLSLYGFSFQSIAVDKKKKVESKIYSKLTKYRKRHSQKIIDDIDLIKKWVESIGEDEMLQIVSNVIDCPNILEAYLPHITEAYVATWSITPAGMSAIESLANSPILEDAVLLIDKTHSYKWVFASGAYEILKKKDKDQVCCEPYEVYSC